MRKKRYESFDKGPGKDFEKGKLTFAKLRDVAAELGEPETRSGKQELYEQLINMYLA
jgi:xylose isomerase